MKRALAIFLTCIWAAVLITACQPGMHAAPAGGSELAASARTAEPVAQSANGQVLLASIRPREETPIPRVASESHPFEEELLVLINQEREKAGLELLAPSHALASIARAHSQDMADQHFFSHNSSNGLSFENRLKAAGYEYSAAAENIFAGNGPYNTPAAALRAWMNSSAHRANLLNANYTEVGIGYRYIPSSPYGGYFTADFGKP